MIAAQARALVDSADVVLLERGGVGWEGRVIGFVEQPALLVEQPDGKRVLLPLSGTQIAARA